ncbi:hypothetical protein ACFQZZ_21335 [Nocardia sp. GCM10030253]|uniref:hypothetical protein n=1 Tax=Nocardia sp. GCM10030253 TaxID=3273404 RepID=UPI003644D8DF
MRATVIAALVGATLLTGATGTAAADLGVPVESTGLESSTGSGSTGSAGGVTTTGSSGTGSSGAALAAFEKLLFGGPLLCAALGSAFNANLTCPGTPGPVIP